jgi:hypothetical protein
MVMHPAEGGMAIGGYYRVVLLGQWRSGMGRAAYPSGFPFHRNHPLWMVLIDSCARMVSANWLTWVGVWWLFGIPCWQSLAGHS